MGEEGSVRTHATHNTRMLHALCEVRNGNGDDMRLDVHYFTSALCPICSRGRTRYVSTVDDDEDDRHPPLWCWRVTNTPWRMQAAGVALSTSQGRGASALPYTNPSGIAGRPYILDDTIDF